MKRCEDTKPKIKLNKNQKIGILVATILTIAIIVCVVILIHL